MGILDDVHSAYRQLACAKAADSPLILSHPGVNQGKLAPEMRRHILCLGMPIDLTPLAEQALIIIAENGPNGVTQADLSKLMGQDARNLHYHLRSLCKHQLISRAPVANRKSFTHLLTWSGFEADSATSQMSQSSRVIKEQMLEVLTQTMNMETLFDRIEGSNPTGARRRFLRRAVSDLIDEGKLVLEDNHLSRKPLAAKSISKVPSQVNLGVSLKTNMPLERQVFEAIRATGSTGCTLPELAKHFKLGTKLIYRIYTRLTLDPSKYLILDEDGVTPVSVEKHTEFHGKERRHRLFVKGETKPEMVPKPEVVPSSESPFGFARDSITRIQRQEAIMRMLLPHTIMDIGRTMALRLQQEMNLTHLPDSKTLRRTILAMEESGMVRCVHVPMGYQGGTRALVMPATMAVDDPRVQEYIHRLRESYIIIPDDENENEGVEKKSVKKYSAERMGHVHGVGQRAKLLHGYILGFECLETTRHLFQELTVELFLKMVGMAESTVSLHQFLKSNPVTLLKEMPAALLRELQQRRAYRHRNVMRQLLELLTDLKLIQVAEGYPAVAYKLPFQYVINRSIEFEGRTFTLPGDFEEYWHAVQEKKPHALLRASDSWLWASPNSATALMKALQPHLNDITDEQIPDLATQHECSMEEICQAINALRQVQHAKQLESRQRRAAKFRETMRRKRQAQEEARRIAGETIEVRRKVREVDVDIPGWTVEERRIAVMTFCGGKDWQKIERALGMVAGEGRRAFIRNCLSGQANLIASIHIEQEYHLIQRAISLGIIPEGSDANADWLASQMPMGSLKWPPARLLLDEFDRIRQSRSSLAEHRLVHRPGVLLRQFNDVVSAPVGVELIKSIVCNNGVQYRGSFDMTALAWLQERGLIADGPVASERLLRGLQAEEPEELEQLAHSLFAPLAPTGKLSSNFIECVWKDENTMWCPPGAPINQVMANRFAHRVRMHVDRHPGITRPALYATFDPILTEREINCLITALVAANLLEVDAFDCLSTK